MATRDYTPDQRQRNLRNIMIGVAGFSLVTAVSGVAQGWPPGSYLVCGLAVGAAAAVLYWLFASPGARPLPADKEHARWPYLSKKKLDEIRSR